jgi:hypothetical protein
MGAPFSFPDPFSGFSCGFFGFSGAAGPLQFDACVTSHFTLTCAKPGGNFAA